MAPVIEPRKWHRRMGTLYPLDDTQTFRNFSSLFKEYIDADSGANNGIIKGLLSLQYSGDCVCMKEYPE